MKDLGINVIPETMRPAECLPWTVGPVCHPGGVTVDACAPTSCGVSPAAYQSTATCIPNSCGVACGCTHITNPCLGCTNAPTVPCVTHTTITICYTGSHCLPHSLVTCPTGTITVCHTGTICPGGSICTGGTTPGTITITPTTPQFQGGGLTRESIAQLRDQLQQQIAQLDEHAKTLGPKTSDEIDAREQQLKAELADLANRRSDLKKSK
jgi:hypothetical protein